MEIPLKMAFKTHISRWHMIIISLLCGFVFITNCLTLIGWLYDINLLKSISPSWVSMVPNTALGFVLSATAIWLIKDPNARTIKKKFSFIISIIVTVLGILTLTEYLFNINLYIDTLLFPHSLEKIERHLYPGRMHPITALDMLLIGLIILLIYFNKGKVIAVQIFSIIIFFTALFSFLGYLYQVHELFIYSKMAFNASISFILLSTAILLSQPESGITHILIRDSIGGASLRKILPLIFIAPILLGCLKYYATDNKVFSFGFELTLIITAFILIFATAAWVSASLLDKQTKKLATSDARLKLALKSSSAGIWSWNLTNNKVIWDEQMQKLFGISESKTPKNYQASLQLIHPDDRKNLNQQINQIIANNKSELETSFRLLKSDNSIHYLELRGRIYREKKSKPSYMTGVCWDVTSQKAAEEKMNQAKVLAEEASNIKSIFMAKISHELRSPLNGIIGFAELIYHEKVGPVSQEHKEYLGDILTSARHLLILINDVLDIAKVESGKMDFHIEKVELPSVLNETKDLFQKMILEKRIQFETQLDPSLKQVCVDPVRFKQVLYNFISNALKYTPDGGKVDVKINPESAHSFKVEVIDTGIGIRSEDISKLFVEFQQLESSISKQYPSTGLGLALAKHIVEAQGGHVGVTSTYGKGSTFYAIFPSHFAAVQS